MSATGGLTSFIGLDELRHRRIDQLHRARRARRAVGRAMRVAAARRASLAIGVQPLPEFQARHRRAMAHERRPRARPAEVAHQLARQAEREVEAAHPGARSREQRLERGERFELFHLLEDERVARQAAQRGGDGLRLARRAGEIDAVDVQGDLLGRRRRAKIAACRPSAASR
jgi:hypothetical protein